MIRALNQVGFARMANEFCRMTREDAREKITRAEASLIECAVGRLVINAGAGQLEPLKILLDRLIGKSPEVVLSSEEEQALSAMPDDELLERGRKALEALERKKGAPHG